MGHKYQAAVPVPVLTQSSTCSHVCRVSQNHIYNIYCIYVYTYIWHFLQGYHQITVIYDVYVQFWPTLHMCYSTSQSVKAKLRMSRVGQNYIYTVLYGIFCRELTEYTVIYGVNIRFWPTLRMRQRQICAWGLGVFTGGYGHVLLQVPIGGGIHALADERIGRCKDWLGSVRINDYW